MEFKTLTIGIMIGIGVGSLIGGGFVFWLVKDEVKLPW